MIFSICYNDNEALFKSPKNYRVINAFDLWNLVKIINDNNNNDNNNNDNNNNYNNIDDDDIINLNKKQILETVTNNDIENYCKQRRSIQEFLLYEVLFDYSKKKKKKKKKKFKIYTC